MSLYDFYVSKAQERAQAAEYYRANSKHFRNTMILIRDAQNAAAYFAGKAKEIEQAWAAAQEAN